MNQLRLYTFVNFYLSSIQAGIQSAHVTHELFVKYKYNFELSSRLYEWAENHKTMIVLNGGMAADLTTLNMFLTCEADKLSFPAPWTSFNEDQASLGGIMTAVGIVLPEEIYDAVNQKTALAMLNREVEGDSEDFFYVDENLFVTNYPKDTPDWRLISILKSCPLAR